MSHKASFGQLALTYCGKFLPLEVLQRRRPLHRHARYRRSRFAGIARVLPQPCGGSTCPRKRRLVPARHSLIQLEESRHESTAAAGSRRSDHAGRAAFAAAPQAFFEAWKRGAEIAGPEWFGDGTREGLNQAKSKWDLRPNMLLLNDALGVLSSGERMFLSAMVSFYNAREGGAMLKRCHFDGLSDFDGLDLQRRKVIADLMVNYSGW